ncbi:MAG: hypothetical protein SFT81_07115 [Candidatus Caenarcaniphilales bacterium]|nr:hypothetical protein [Candidatus Caenarcaniphilales bacterium]
MKPSTLNSINGNQYQVKAYFVSGKVKYGSATLVRNSVGDIAPITANHVIQAENGEKPVKVELKVFNGASAQTIAVDPISSSNGQDSAALKPVSIADRQAINSQPASEIAQLPNSISQLKNHGKGANQATGTLLQFKRPGSGGRTDNPSTEAKVIGETSNGQELIIEEPNQVLQQGASGSGAIKDGEYEGTLSKGDPSGTTRVVLNAHNPIVNEELNRQIALTA